MLDLYAPQGLVSSVKVSYHLYDTPANAAQKIFQSDNIQSLVVSNFLISNLGNANAAVSVYLFPPKVVPTNTSADNVYGVILGYSLSANNYIEGHGGFVVLPGGYSVWVNCDKGNAAVFSISGDLGANLGDTVT
jgi:hypothetical protein